MEEVTDTKEGLNHISIDEEVLSNSLAKRLKHKLGKLSPLSPECCIYRVPAELREGNGKSFTPQLISIGPLHYNNEKLKDMKEHKMRFLNDYLSRAQVSLDDCVELLKRKEVKLRNCYADPIEFDSDKFIEIILIDAAFIVEVFLRSNNTSSNKQVQKNHNHEHDHFFGRPWKLRFIKNDMLLLENQVPFFIIEELLSLTGSSIPIIKLTYEFFRTRMYLKDIDNFNVLEKVGQSEIQHFVDFARICHLPQEMPQKSKLKSLTLPTATQLHQAGVKFRVRRQSRDLFDIQFKDGVLEIPLLRINNAIENFLRNLIAYEHYHLRENFVNDYVFILDRLIDTPDDVELLAQNGIIESKLAGNQEVASVINKLSPGITLIRFNFYFSHLCKELNDYYIAPWHKWKATLKQDYFTNPWAIISLIAAIMLLILTIVQTYYSVASYY